MVGILDADPVQKGQGWDFLWTVKYGQLPSWPVGYLIRYLWRVPKFNLVQSIALRAVPQCMHQSDLAAAKKAFSRRSLLFDLSNVLFI